METIIQLIAELEPEEKELVSALVKWIHRKTVGSKEPPAPENPTPAPDAGDPSVAAPEGQQQQAPE